MFLLMMSETWNKSKRSSIFQPYLISQLFRNFFDA